MNNNKLKFIIQTIENDNKYYATNYYKEIFNNIFCSRSSIINAHNIIVGMLNIIQLFTLFFFHNLFNFQSLKCFFFN